MAKTKPADEEVEEEEEVVEESEAQASIDDSAVEGSGESDVTTGTAIDRYTIDTEAEAANKGVLTDDERLEQWKAWYAEHPDATRVPPQFLPNAYQDPTRATPGLPPGYDLSDPHEPLEMW